MPLRLHRLWPAAACAALALLGLVAGIWSSAAPSASRAAATTTSPSDLAPIHGKYAPVMRPVDFVDTVDNRYWPLKPGTTFHFKGVSGTTPQTDDVVVTRRTKLVLGIKCTVVRDTVSEHGKPVERTFDWYAQDKHGNVWYMGEDSFELEHGRFVKANDSWKAGVNGAKPGIIMPAKPRPGDSYRQEYYPPEALDEARVVSLRGSVQVPYGSFKRALVTSEVSPVEPQPGGKRSVAGVGEVRERIVKGPRAELRLVSVTR